jgi:hypothetical protein
MMENKLEQDEVVSEGEDFVALRSPVGVEVWTAGHEEVIGVLPGDSGPAHVNALVNAYRLGLRRGRLQLALEYCQLLGIK